MGRLRFIAAPLTLGTDPSVEQSDIRGVMARFFGHDLAVVMRDGRLWIDRPFIKVGRDLPPTVTAPNIRNVVKTDEEVAEYRAFAKK